jgi:hypothetical protein
MRRLLAVLLLKRLRDWLQKRLKRQLVVLLTTKQHVWLLRATQHGRQKKKRRLIV